MRIPQFHPQVISQEIVLHLIERLVQLGGNDFQRQPSMVTAGQMIALQERFPVLVLFTAGQMFDAAIQFFDLPVCIVRVLSNLCDQRLIRAIRNHPFNIAFVATNQVMHKQ